MSSRRSRRIRSRFIPWYQAMVRSTTHRIVPSPVPWAWPRRAMRGLIPLAHTSLRYFVVVVAAVSEQLVRTLAWSSFPAAHGRDRVQQWEHLGHVVAVAATQGDRKGNTVPIG